MPATNPLDRDRAGGAIREAWSIFRLALRVRRDPVPFCRAVSAGVPRYLRTRGIELRSARVLDVGAGGGALAEAMAEAGSRVVALDVQDHRGPAIGRTPFVRGRGEHLPFSDGAFDVVLSSNVLEHVGEPSPLIAELGRVCRPGGHVWLSWTNWLSPIGGHEMTPFHYLGPQVGQRIYRAVWRRPPR